MSEEQNNTELVEIKAEPVAEPKAEAPVEPKVEASAPVEAPVGNSGATLQDALAGVLGGIKLESKPEAAKSETDAAPKPAQQGRPEGQRPPRPQGDRPPREPRPQGDRPQGDRPQGGDRGPRPGGGPPNRENRGAGGGDRGPRPGGDRPQGDRGPRPGGDRPGGDRGGYDRPRFDAPEIELEKLISDSLYLDNQAHAIVSRMRDMDTGTKSQLRRLYNAVRRAVRAPEGERQHEFVMLRARVAYTIARHSLRSLDQIEKLLLQVTRKNETRGYERFKDLFEAVIAYNE
jgi:CRISPR type III-A-associated protein Csm2